MNTNVEMRPLTADETDQVNGGSDRNPLHAFAFLLSWGLGFDLIRRTGTLNAVNLEPLR